MNNIQLGQMNRLQVLRRVDFGFYLDGGEAGDILLPTKEAPKPLPKTGDEIEVFLYLDQEERLVATTRQPHVMVGGTANLRVAWVNRYGAFMDWGLMKDLFVPFHEQKTPMHVGEWHNVYVYIDDVTHRIVASSKAAAKMSGTDKTKPASKGDGRQKIADFTDVLLQRIKDEGGRLHLGDKSDAEEIYAAFGVSKKVFKQAVGALYKRRLIDIAPQLLTLNPHSKP